MASAVLLSLLLPVAADSVDRSAALAAPLAPGESPAFISTREVVGKIEGSKVSDYLIGTLEPNVAEPNPDPSRAAEKPFVTRAVSSEVLANQLVSVLIRPNAKSEGDLPRALDNVVRLEYLFRPVIIDSLGQVAADVAVSDLQRLVASPAVAFVDAQRPAHFQRAGATSPSSFVGNRVAELRRLLKDRRGIPARGNGLRIGVISDGIGGAMWFSKQSQVAVPRTDCNNTSTSTTIIRNNPVVPIAYNAVWDGDLPTRDLNEAVVLDRFSGEQTDYTNYYQVINRATGAGARADFVYLHANGVGFRSFNTAGISGSYPFFVTNPSIFGDGSGCTPVAAPNSQPTPGFPEFAEDQYRFLLNFVLGSNGSFLATSINDYVLRTVYDNSGFPANEGTAILDVLRDYVPDAEFFFINAFSLGNYLTAHSLLMAAGCDLIVTDAVFLQSGRNDGIDNPLAARYALHAEANGITMTAAGNLAQQHHASNVSDTDGDGFHAFSGTDETLRIRVQPGETVQVYLSWNEVPAGNATFRASRHNLNLYLLDPTDPSILRPLARSVTPQEGLGGQVPFEALSITNSTALTRNADIAVTFPIGTPSSIPMSIYAIAASGSTTGVTLVEYVTPAGSMADGPDALEALAIGELDSFTRNTITATSSRGPVMDSDVIKPDFVVASGVRNATGAFFIAASNSAIEASGVTVNGVAASTSVLFSPNNDPLTGTSGALAEAAGMTALLMSFLDEAEIEKPPFYSKRINWIRSLLAAGVRDIYGVGAENLAGFGVIDPFRVIVPLLRNEGERFFYSDFNMLAEKNQFLGSAHPELGYTPPIFGDLNNPAPSALTLTATNNTSTWGYFWSGQIQFQKITGGTPVADGSGLDPSKIYRVTARVAEEFSAQPSPTVRIRAQARDSSVIHGQTLNDIGYPDASDQFETDDLGGGVFVHYFRPTAASAAVGMEINIDIISVDPRTASQQTMLLQELEILELNDL